MTGFSYCYVFVLFCLGELIGVEYLYHQTNKVLGEYSPDDASGDDDDDDDDDDFRQHETRLDPTIPPIEGSSQSNHPMEGNASVTTSKLESLPNNQ